MHLLHFNWISSTFDNDHLPVNSPRNPLCSTREWDQKLPICWETSNDTHAVTKCCQSLRSHLCDRNTGPHGHQTTKWGTGTSSSSSKFAQWEIFSFAAIRVIMRCVSNDSVENCRLSMWNSIGGSFFNRRLVTHSRPRTFKSSHPRIPNYLEINSIQVPATWLISMEKNSCNGKPNKVKSSTSKSQLSVVGCSLTVNFAATSLL
jgi:hypothetical protein